MLHVEIQDVVERLKSGMFLDVQNVLMNIRRGMIQYDKKKVSCEDCNGACCKWIVMKVEDDGLEEYTDIRGLDVVDGYLAIPAPPCPFLIANKCDLHSTARKPRICRALQPGDMLCLLCRKLEKIGADE